MTELKRLRIGPRHYQIRYRSFRQIYGQIALGSGFLDLADDLTEEESVYAIIHEVLHGIWYHRKMPERPREERSVTELAWGLTHLFRDNPGLLMHLEKLLQEAR